MGRKAKIVTKKIGAVTIRPFKESTVRLDFTWHGKRHRPVITVTGQVAADHAATRVARAIENMQAGVASEHPLAIVSKLQGNAAPVETGPKAKGAMEQAIAKGSAAAIRTKDEMRDAANLFLDWLDLAYPKLEEGWESITYSIVQEYVNTFTGLSLSRMKHRLDPISLAGNYWQREAPSRYRNPCIGVRFPEAAPGKQKSALTIDQVRQIHLDLEGNPLQPILALSTYTGLRILEVGALRYCDVDLVKRRLTVTQTDLHRPKTRASHRVIPIPAVAVAILQQAMTVQPIDVTEPIFRTHRGLVWTAHRIGHSWGRFTEKHPQWAFHEPRGSRRTFATLAIRAGLDRELVKVYLGQRAGDILGTHYVQVSLADLQAVPDAIDKLFGHDMATKISTGNNI